MKTRRKASFLPLAALALAVAAVVGIALVTRVTRSLRTGAWSMDRVLVEQVAESAIEELYARMQVALNDPASRAYTTLRQLAAGSSPVALEGLELETLGGDLATLEQSASAKLEVSFAAAIVEAHVVSSDPLERVGITALEARVRLLRGGRIAARTTLRVERDFRLARVTPPPPFDQAGLVVARTGRRELAGGGMAWARAVEPSRLIDLLTNTGDRALQPVPPGAQRAVQASVATLTPAALAARAQFVVTTPEQLSALLAGPALNGVVLARFRAPVELELPAFHGRCLLAFQGPVTVKRIRMSDPARDLLSIVSAAGIVADGDRIEASLIALRTGVRFAKAGLVLGCVVSGRFPRARGIDWRELGDCRFSANPALAGAGLVALLAPRPRATRHIQEGA